MSVVKDAILVELQERVTKSQQYNEKLTSAKTKTKKDFYLKKLSANNNIVADLIAALERLNKKNGESNGTPSTEEGNPEDTSAQP